MAVVTHHDSIAQGEVFHFLGVATPEKAKPAILHGTVQGEFKVGRQQHGMGERDATHLGVEGLVGEEQERIVDDARVWKGRELGWTGKGMHTSDSLENWGMSIALAFYASTGTIGSTNTGPDRMWIIFSVFFSDVKRKAATLTPVSQSSQQSNRNPAAANTTDSVGCASSNSLRKGAFTLIDRYFFPCSASLRILRDQSSEMQRT